MFTTAKSTCEPSVFGACVLSISEESISPVWRRKQKHLPVISSCDRSTYLCVCVLCLPLYLPLNFPNLKDLVFTSLWMLRLSFPSVASFNELTLWSVNKKLLFCLLALGQSLVKPVDKRRSMKNPYLFWTVTRWVLNCYFGNKLKNHPLLIKRIT